MSQLGAATVSSEEGAVPVGSLRRRVSEVSDGKECHKSWLQSWSRSLQRKRRDSVVVSCKVYAP
jgi:hypothetical protein